MRTKWLDRLKAHLAEHGEGDKESELTKLTKLTQGASVGSVSAPGVDNTTFVSDDGFGVQGTISSTTLYRNGKTLNPTDNELTKPTKVLRAWRGRVLRATDWGALQAILNEAQANSSAGTLSSTEVETIAQWCSDYKHLPESAALETIDSDSILPLMRTECFACGTDSWWTDRVGVRKCRVCHPPAPGAEDNA